MTEPSRPSDPDVHPSPAADAGSGFKRLTSPESLAVATPMMRQFLELKAAHPDELLFYQMTGVPVQTADDYLDKLIDRGYRVAVCEQVEDPAQARKRGSKSLMLREVRRLVTPGTLTEDKLLTPARSNYLMALARVKGEGGMALAWVDISTGIFQLAETSARRLVADVMRIDPRGVVVADSVFHDESLRAAFDQLGMVVAPQPAVLFDSGSAEGRLARFFEVGTLDGFGTFSRSELAAAAAVIAYIEKTQMGERPLLSRPVRESTGSTLFIDPATRTNLGLNQAGNGSVSVRVMTCPTPRRCGSAP